MRMSNEIDPHLFTDFITVSLFFYIFFGLGARENAEDFFRI